MSVFEPNSRHLREVLIFCFHAVRLLLMEQHGLSGFNASRAVILMSRTGMAVEKRKFSKIPKWRHYWLKARAKHKKNWQNHWE